MVFTFTGVFLIGFGYYHFEYEVQQKKIVSVKKSIKETNELVAATTSSLAAL